ncbi:MAG: nucleotidyltransferase domain-containing protein [Planctomycetota bacterium]
MIEAAGLPNAQLLADLVRRIVEAVQPRRIVLFGSAARGELGPDSDLDALVVVPDGTHPGRAEEAAYRSLWGFGFPVDVLAVTEGDLGRHQANPYLVYYWALKDGRELYRVAG